MRLGQRRAARSHRRHGAAADQRKDLLAAHLVRHRRDRDAGDCHRGIASTPSTSITAMFSPRAAHDVLLAVDEEQRPSVACVDDVAGVEPAAGPGFGGRASSFRYLGEEAAARRGALLRAPATRPPRRARTSAPASSTMR